MPRRLATALACQTASGPLTWLSEAKTVTSYDTKGATIAGVAPPAFGTDGTMYIATGAGASEVANAVVSLDSKSLTQKDWLSISTPFTSIP